MWDPLVVSGSAGTGNERGWRSGNVWAQPQDFENNPVRQLLVPAGTFTTVSGSAGRLEVSNNFGAWPAVIQGQAQPADQLWLKIQGTPNVGDELRSAEWSRPRDLPRSSAADVLDSYGGAIGLVDADGEPGLRTPQRGAVHAVLGYWTTNRKTPATVVMPTGTGKTETMLALLVAARLPRLLVLVPSDALRRQVADKFTSLGVLQELGVISSTAQRPVVGRIGHGFRTTEAALAFARACNVIVATPNVLGHCDPAARAAFLSECSHLFIDEAHHVAATTWSAVREAFEDKDVVQFTATPFREDGRPLAGRVVYAFPLREAQAQKYFSSILYTSVVDFSDVDKAVAEQSVARLRDDLTAGYDHVLMARVRSIPRAEEVVQYYQAIAPDLHPVTIDSRMGKRDQAAALKALRERQSRIIVCVNMLGEGFDLAALKIAAIHDPQKSLGVTLQFVGRFARTSETAVYGTASAFVARTELEVDRRLRELYAEDSDWNLILRDLSEAAVQAQQDASDFEDGFTSRPEEVDLRNLLPKLSTVVYRAHNDEWQPDRIIDHFGAENLLTQPIGLNTDAGVAWCVVKKNDAVRWGNVKTIEEVTYQLFVLYFDRDRKLLYINNSANDGVFEELAAEVLGPGAERFTGSTVYRVMADIERLVPTNVGVIDIHDQFRRFSMHVGSDVTASFSDAEAGTKSQTNISGGGFRGGEHVNISASLKGRIWSHATAESLKQWCEWCDGVGDKLLDDTISIDQVINQFILPERLSGRPEGVLLALEWPWTIHMQQSETVRLAFQGKVQEAAYTDLVPDTSATTGPFRFEVRTGSWSVPYDAAVDANGHLQYRCRGKDEVMVVRARSEVVLSAWLQANGLIFLMDDDRLIEDDLLYRPKRDRSPFDRRWLTPVDWKGGGTDLTVESQTAKKLTNSIQYRVIQELLTASPAWDVIIDDDGAGEIADVVALRIEGDEIVVLLVHCKFSHGKEPGVRVADVYEVCGQAQKSVRWRRNDLRPFFRTLADRARKKQNRTGVSPFEAGEPRELLKIEDMAAVLRRRVEMIIVQPGLSQHNASEQQLDVLASTQTYLRSTINASLAVWCSD